MGNQPQSAGVRAVSAVQLSSRTPSASCGGFQKSARYKDTQDMDRQFTFTAIDALSSNLIPDSIERLELGSAETSELYMIIMGGTYQGRAFCRRPTCLVQDRNSYILIGRSATQTPLSQLPN